MNFIATLLTLSLCYSVAHSADLPFDTVFKGRSRFEDLVSKAGPWSSLPIGDRVSAVGKALVGTAYRNYTLEIDDHIEAPSANLTAVDCWTFFEQSLAFARMLNEPRERWIPQVFLKYIELDRYRGGTCTGSYLSRLHYLEEWLTDNDRRGLVKDLTRTLGGIRVAHTTGEMTVNWRSYRYMRANPDLREGVRQMEQRIAPLPFYHIPKDRVAAIEAQLRSGDIIGITTHDVGGVGTSHVGLAFRGADNVLHFMHASSPRNYAKVVIDSRLSDYLNRFRSNAGIIVARPIR